MMSILSLIGALPWFSDSNCGRGDILQSLKPNHGVSMWLVIYVIWLLSQSPSLIKNVKQGNKQCRGLQPLNPPLGGNNSQVNERSSANRGFEISWFSEMCLGQSAWLRSSPKGTKVVFLCFRSIVCRDSLYFLLPWEMSRHLKVFYPREQIAHWMETTLDEATDPWGVKVERVEMWAICHW